MTLFDKKWQKFLSRIWPFRFIPFIDFVLASGSLATGNMNENSDFDVIVGVRQGRIFTARFLCWLFFGLLGWRAKHSVKLQRPADIQYFTLLNVRYSSSDKLCFNHFITPNAYRLSPPYNKYWKKLYKNLAPVYGDPEIIQKFFDANSDWAGPVRNSPPNGSLGPRLRAGVVSNGMEWLLSGTFGDWLEKILKSIQIWKIRNSRNSGIEHKPRIVVSDDELQFHPNTERGTDAA